ncbi:hypothetical protein TNCT_114981 [Trichonephila clavata]|uniref:Uncharacterized protein n=1 Tax=Trichonephila clavata TaxID=2740835 RepID=A0A8X6LS99_TRICU|nr:hypothetical protein TNCT_114981 [Trichonephila clavata]
MTEPCPRDTTPPMENQIIPGTPSRLQPWTRTTSPKRFVLRKCFEMPPTDGTTRRTEVGSFQAQNACILRRGKQTKF